MDYQSLMTSAYKTLKKVTPILVSVSVFSFFFSYSSLYSLLLRSIKYLYFNALPLQVLNHAVDKGWIFLICNGILVVLANTTSSTTCMNLQYSSPSGKFVLREKIGDDDHILHPLMLEDKVLSELSMKENAASHEVEGEEKDINTNEGENNSNLIVKYEELEEKGSEELRITIIGDEDSENELETCFICEEEEMQEEEEEEEEEEEGTLMEKLSTEELNKKFEDFIRRMKEELRIEAAQQQLIVVK